MLEGESIQGTLGARAATGQASRAVDRVGAVVGLATFGCTWRSIFDRHMASRDPRRGDGSGCGMSGSGLDAGSPRTARMGSGVWCFARNNRLWRWRDGWSGAIAYSLISGCADRPVRERHHPRRWWLWLAAIALYGAWTLYVVLVQPVPRYDLNQSPILRIYVPAASPPSCCWQAGK